MELPKPTYQPTVYEQIVRDFLEGKDIKYEDYQAELAERGWTDKRYFDVYKKDMEFIKSLMDSPDFNLRQAADVIKKHHTENFSKEDTLYFSLTDKEQQTLSAYEEDFLFKDGEIVEYDGYDKQIVCADYKNLPPSTDAYVIFSGHPASAEAATEAWFEDLKRTGEPKKLIFLGLYDNQGNTDFSNQDLKYNTGSEVEMYVRYCRKLGISEEILKECLVTPNDTSTKDNIALLAEIRNKQFGKNEDASFAMFGYPIYQKRIASEFAFEFNQMEKSGQVKSTNFVMPVVPLNNDINLTDLPYDSSKRVKQDISVGNCMAHPYRVSAGGRFNSDLGAYPDKLKPLLPLSLVYSYPNVANELAGTDTRVGTMMKLLRAAQHESYQMENPRIVDHLIQINLDKHRKKMAVEGLAPADLLFDGNKLSKKEYIKAITTYQKDATLETRAKSAAQALYGSSTVNPHKIEGATQYFLNEFKNKKRA